MKLLEGNVVTSLSTGGAPGEGVFPNMHVARGVYGQGAWMGL